MMYYDKDGLPISLQSWAVLFETDSYRILKQDTAADGSWVSTTWLGIDRTKSTTRPMVFETMVFSDGNCTNVLDGRRYVFESEALKGHDELLAARNAAPRHHLRKVEI